MEEFKKRLLFVNNRFPYPVEMGIDMRVTNLLEALSRKFDIDFVCIVGSKEKFNYIPELKKYCHHVEAFLVPNRKSQLHRLIYKISFAFSYLFKGTPSHFFYTNLSEIKKRILNLIQNNHYDIIFFEYWFWDKRLINACKGLKVIDANDIQFERIFQFRRGKFQAFSNVWIRFQRDRYMKRECEHLNLFDLIIVTTDKDKKTLQNCLSSQKEIVISPTGVDTDYFSPRVVPNEESLVFYGDMSHSINIDGGLYLYKEIMPLIWNKKKNVKLSIVGNSPPAEIKALDSDHRVTVTGYVKDVRDWLAMAKVVVLPLRFEFGHRGRIYEVMAMGIPLVVTPQAIKGMGLQNGEGLLIADSPVSITEAVLKILNNTEYATELGMKGRKTVCERFSKAATYDRLTGFLYEYSKRRE
ncbi:MAG: glycosyltransferase family 4 protein [Proteobacteria bacterium]|nr:glycosyltransferase family 4 protein [Pseudomonadota bacterium]